MVKRRLSLLAVVLSLVVSGCVVEQRDFVALRDQVRLQQKQIQDLKARQEELALRGDALNNGFKILGDKAEENARRLDDLEDQSSLPTYRDVDPVVSEAPPPAELPVPAPAPPPQAEAPILLSNVNARTVPEPPPGGEIITAGPKAEKLYARALALYSGRDYRQATEKFEEFVSLYSDHKLAGNAQYWIGECYYSQKRFAEAAEEFDRVEKTYPTSRKVPAALFKKALSFAEIRKMPEARAVLQRLIDNHGQSEEAVKAMDKLKRWNRP